MGTIAASAIISKAAEHLHDVDHVRWTAAELLYWLNEGQRAIAILRPEAKTINGSVKLVAGTKQTIPATGIRLHKVIRNMGADGSTAGKVIFLIDVSTLDQFNPDWHTDDSDSDVLNYMFDGNDPLTFYVFPPQPETNQGYVEQAYSASPDDLDTVDDPIDILDVFQSALFDYLIFRANTKDSDYAGKDGVAAAEYGLFLSSLGLKAKSDQTISPNRNTPPIAQEESSRV